MIIETWNDRTEEDLIPPNNPYANIDFSYDSMSFTKEMTGILGPENYPDHQFRIKTPDNRLLTIEDRGDPEGVPFFLLHGQPGCIEGPRIPAHELTAARVRLVTYTRPGYNGSDRLIGRDVSSAADDIITIADYLGISRFCVIGRSGSGSHALACAAKYPHRLIAAASLGGMAPSEDFHEDWSTGMSSFNSKAYSHENLETWIRSQAKAVLERPSALPPIDGASFPDKFFINQHRHILEQVRGGYVTALLHGGHWGWHDDIMANKKPWNVDLSAIPSDLPIYISHGLEDAYSPFSHAEQLLTSIPHARLWESPLGHLWMLIDTLNLMPVMLTYNNQGEYLYPDITSYAAYKELRSQIFNSFRAKKT